LELYYTKYVYIIRVMKFFMFNRQYNIQNHTKNISEEK